MRKGRWEKWARLFENELLYREEVHRGNFDRSPFSVTLSR
jgi:hypothetical protein